MRRAATEIDQSPPTRPNAFLGSPTLLRYERIVDVEVATSAYEVLVDEIQRSLGVPGIASTVGHTLSWTSGLGTQPSGRIITVAVVPRNGRTTVRVEESLRNVAGGLFGGLMGGLGGGGTGPAMGIGIGLLHSVPAAVGVSAVFIGTSYVAARTILRVIATKRERQLSTLADRLAEHVAAG